MFFNFIFIFPLTTYQKNDILYICYDDRSGKWTTNKEALGKLADLGYTNIVEFGGIIDWTGPVELG